MLAVLPAELAAEAQALRRELEAHHRQMQERLFGHGSNTLSNIIRNTGEFVVLGHVGLRPLHRQHNLIVYLEFGFSLSEIKSQVIVDCGIYQPLGGGGSLRLKT